MYIIRSGQAPERMGLWPFLSSASPIEMGTFSLNWYADAISRIVDYDDWSLNKVIFSYLDAYWCPHTVDCLASPYNKQVERFHSCFWSPGCEAVDTFTVNWGNDVNWWLPPLYLVCHTIQHAAKYKAKETLVVPAWNSAPDGRHLASFIHLWWSTRIACS